VRNPALIFFFFLSLPGYFSQLDNSSLFFNTSVDTSREKMLFVKIQNLNFMKNNEYSNVMFDGYTLFGYQFNPQLGYQMSKNLSIEGGVFFNKDFGNNSFTQVIPTFSLRYYKKDFKMVFGNLDGSLNHQLVEPLYNFERVITNRLENGVQFTLNKKYFDFDVWIDWLKMIYRSSSDQEKIMSGINVNALKFKNEQWEFRMPLQGTVIHYGGQIDTVQNGSQSDYCSATGIVVTRKTKSGIIKDVYLDARYVLRSNNYFSGATVIQNWGDGFLGNIGIKGTYQTDLLLSYWYGDSFYNELGGDLYSSVSRTVAYPYYQERIRELAILRLTKKIDLAKGVKLTLRVEPYYDFRDADLEYSYGFYISIDEKIWLKNKPATSIAAP